MLGKRTFSALSVILAVLMLFASAVVFTSCEGPGGALLNEPDGKSGAGQKDTGDSAGSDGPVIIPSYRLGNDSSSQGDAAGKDGSGTQAPDGGEQQTGAGSKGQETEDGREDRQASGGSSGQQTGNGSEDRQASGGTGKQVTSGGGNTAAGKVLDPPDSFFASDRARKYIDVDWKPVKYEAKVPQYKVKPDLSNVENASRFGGFSEKQLKMLSENGFVVVPSDDEQLFYVYEENDYLEIPSFITVDSVLQAYHVFYNYSLRMLEYEYLLKDLEKLTDSMLRKSLVLYDAIRDPEVKEAALKNTAYFSVAQMVLGKELPPGVPDEARKIAEAEFRSISDPNGPGRPSDSGIADYTQFTVRGHYTRNDDLGRYFKAMMWYGLYPFPLSESALSEEAAVQDTLQALLITYSLFTDGEDNGDGAADTGEIVGGSKTADMGGTSVKTVVDTEADAAGGSGSVDVTVAADQGESADGDKTTDAAAAAGGGYADVGSGSAGKGKNEEGNESINTGEDTNLTVTEKMDRVSDIDLWENIYDPTVFYVGSADDLTVYHYKELIVKCYGRNPDPETFADRTKLNRFLDEAKKLPRPLIQPQEGQQFRFMGQRYIPDSEILQELCGGDRLFPKGLDVMGVLGSDRAYDLLTNVYNVVGRWKLYPEKFREVKEKFDSLPDEEWRSNMYYGWLWVLKTLTGTFGKGYPSFMTGQAWQDKSLNTALASWAELRHDTILYGKQSAVECGGEEGLEQEPPPVIIGYVEPNIGAYERMLWLTRYSRENLAARNILPWDLKYKMQEFEELLQFLINCSVKELRNEELTFDEYERIRYYGATLELLTSSFVEDGSWYEITSETDKNMAVIADIHNVGNSYLNEGVGTAFHIYTVVPVGGKLYLTRGAVFSYYEFVSGTRFTDEEWQEMLWWGYNPSLPEWTRSFIDIGGAGRFIVTPADQDEPDDLGYPDDPGYPAGPDEPEYPGDPDVPGNPVLPDGPEHPGDPDVPGNPVVPDGPEYLGDPDEPEYPDTLMSFSNRMIRAIRASLSTDGLPVPTVPGFTIRMVRSTDGLPVPTVPGFTIHMVRST